MSAHPSPPPAGSANFDAAELAKFSALAHRWWDPTSEFRPLHEINPLRLAHIERLAGGLAGKRVVDVGCGGGILAEAMAARGADVTGIDLADKPLKVAMLHAKESGTRAAYRLVSAEDLAAEEPGAFDMVTCMEMLEHVPDPGSTVAACARLVRPGGQVFFSTINRNPKSFLFAIVGAEYVLRLLPRGTHEYARFIRPSELAAYGREAGLALEDLTGMTYNPVTRAYALGPDVGVNYLGGVPQMIRAVLFDLDGTLADTAPDMARIVNLMRGRRGLAPAPLEQLRPHVSRGARGMICSGFGMTTEHPDYAPMREEFLALYGENLCIDTRLFPGMHELLEALEARAVAWGVVTNKFERFARPLIDTLGLSQRAAIVVGGDTCARAKPFPDPLLYAAQKLAIAPADVVYVGDDERDIQAARAAGMPSLAAAYGYLGVGAPVEAWGADAVVGSAQAIGEWVSA